VVFFARIQAFCGVVHRLAANSVDVTSFHVLNLCPTKKLLSPVLQVKANVFTFLLGAEVRARLGRSGSLF